MTPLDYFVLVVVMASVAAGAVKGILKGLIGLLFAVVGLVAAAHLYPVAAPLMSAFVETPRAANLLGFVAILVAVIAAGGLTARGLRGALKRTRLGWVDHLCGAAFGLLRGWLVCSAIYLALTAFPVRLGAVERAAFAPALLEGTRVIAYLTSRDLRDKFLNGYETVKQLWQKKP